LRSAKPSREDIARDAALWKLAEIVREQPGWRFDLALLGTPTLQPPVRYDAADMSREQIEETLAKARSIHDGGFEPQAVVTAWSAFEDLEAISRVRNVIVHGFESPPIGPDDIELLDGIAHRLLNETEVQASSTT
jgi:hypothetical protein